MAEYLCGESRENNSNQMAQKCNCKVELELIVFKFMMRNRVNVIAKVHRCWEV